MPRSRQSSGKKHRPWSAAEDQFLQEAYSLSTRVRLIASRLGRTVEAVVHRASLKKLTIPSRRAFWVPIKSRFDPADEWDDVLGRY